MPSVTIAADCIGNKNININENNDKEEKTPPLSAKLTANTSNIPVSRGTSLHSESRQQQLHQNLQQTSQLPFNLEGKFLVQPTFLQVIRKVKGVDPINTVFTYKEVSITQVIKYI